MFTEQNPEIYNHEGVYYYKKSKKQVGKHIHNKIKKLGIPPAYETLWVCTNINSNIQAIALDSKNRKQYYYNEQWKISVSNKKYKRMGKFMKKMPLFWRLNNKNINYVSVCTKNKITKFSKRKVIAFMFQIMKITNIRVGNKCYEGVGLTTLKKENIEFKNDLVILSFKGKSGVEHKLKLKDKKICNFIRDIHKIPNEWLFVYRSSNDNLFYRISSDHMNKYLQNIIGKEFTCKDFRTHAANKIFLKFIQKCEISNKNKTINKALEHTAEKLGHNKSTSKNSYVSEKLIEFYKNNPNKIKNQDIKKVLLKVYK